MSYKKVTRKNNTKITDFMDIIHIYMFIINALSSLTFRAYQEEDWFNPIT
jgi:hypothetical protein